MTPVQARPNGTAHQKIAALTGLRGVAIFAVIAGHIVTLHYPRGTSGYWPTLLLHQPIIGVQVFFALSGFLITGILAREKAKTGRISLRRFYARRAYRIWPAFYTYLTVVAVLAAWGVYSAGWKDLTAAALYVSNYMPVGCECLSHTWSLAVEEQFYLLWPLTLVLLSPRWALRLAFTGIVAAPVWRFWLYHSIGTVPVWHFETRVDAMLYGAALALALHLYPQSIPAARQWMSRLRLVPAAVAAILATVMAGEIGNGDLWHAFANSVVGGAAAVLIFAATGTTGILVPVLQNRLLVWLGTISFSLYLWQQLFDMPRSPLPLAVGLPLMFLVAAGSYLLVEKPFLKVKDRRATLRRQQ